MPQLALIGQVWWTAAQYAPLGCAVADGSLLPIDQNQALYEVCGSEFGGDGSQTMALPGLTGRAIVGGDGAVGGTGSVAANGDVPTAAFIPVVAMMGLFPSGPALAGIEPYLGEIVLLSVADVSDLDGMVPCDGRTLSIAENQAMFALIGTQYGGDGQSTFAVPDLRGAIPATVDGGLGAGDGIPTVELTYAIATSGVFPSRAN